ncbi:sulfotransferase [Roseovarius sp. S1116L3]|uniref:sulfotransferase n=1 Tax=Roseovarius roseus TaxID=3342636 RepID=UPI0037288100
MIQNRLLLHVGYHKTGTTWLQNVGFNQAHGFHQVLSHVEVFDKIVQPHRLSFSVDTAREFLQKRLASMPSDWTPVISSEIICGNPFYGGRESCEYCDRLYKISPNAKILFTIREQHKALVSTYMQYLARGGTETPSSFFLSKPSLGYFSFSIDHFKYDRLISYYQDRFGVENIMVVTQEDLAKDPLNTLTEILRFSESDLELGQLFGPQRFGISFPEIIYPILRRINYLRFQPAGRSAVINLGRAGDLLYEFTGVAGHRLTQLVRPPLIVHKFVKDTFSGEFSESNQRLQKQLHHNINLEGYEL